MLIKVLLGRCFFNYKRFAANYSASFNSAFIGDMTSQFTKESENSKNMYLPQHTKDADLLNCPYTDYYFVFESYIWKSLTTK